MTRFSSASFVWIVGAALGFSSLASAQSNVIPGRDLMLINTWDVAQFQRIGTYPNGAGAMGAWTTVCNPGTAPISFTAPMSPAHAYIHYLVCRESNGRFVQISNWGWVKHTFGSSNDPSGCGTCAGPGNFNQVEVGCSDTYANYQAVDHYWLGPPEEINPWLGTWDPVCSHFDRGEPQAPASQLCDGVRSLSSQQANALNSTLNHQVRVADQDLIVPSANYFFQSGYLCPGEPELNRLNNVGSRQFTSVWNGTSWQMTDGVNFINGPIVQRWNGSTMTSSPNAGDDGRFYVAVKVTGPINGIYHYEYAIQNRDNKRGLGAFRLPVCPTAQVSNMGFRDIDQSAANDWTSARIGSQISFSTVSNPLRWNCLFNFWFDSDAAPLIGQGLSLDQFDIGAGALTVNVSGTAPMGLFNATLGLGCGNPTAPTLCATGNPARASLGNATFALESRGNPATVACGFVFSTLEGSTVLATGCTLYSASTSSVSAPFMVFSDPQGVASLPLSIPNDVVFEGMRMDFQSFNIQGGGALLGNFNLSSGLRIRIGNLLSGCP
ncbi:MAG: hypothetical protein WCR59_07215 [Planctomycetota bacterium]